MNRRKATKSALALSLFLMIFWMLLGAGTSIAWFMDESPIIKNTFDIGILDLEVSHKVGESYEKIKADTKVFDDQAIYEPGYTQVVRLKVENKGDIPFDYKLSVIPNLQTLVEVTSVKGNTIRLPEYLKFGVVLADTEAELEEMIRDRACVRECATLALSTYFNGNTSYDTEKVLGLEADGTDYAAVIVWMPEEVGNEANYIGDTPPQVELGISVKASQQGTP